MNYEVTDMEISQNCMTQPCIIPAKTSKANIISQAPEAFPEDTFSLSSSHAPLSAGEKELTILFYMNGEYRDIGQMVQSSRFRIEDAGADKNINIVAQLGYTPEKPAAQSQPIHYDVRRYVVTQSEKRPTSPGELEKPEVYSSEEKLPGNVSISTPGVLEDFICWGIKNHPARHYMIVFMGHGDSLKGALGFTPVQMEESVKKGLEKANNSSGRKDSIDISVFNCCLMGNVEALYQMRGMSDYTLASEDVASGNVFDDWPQLIGGIKKQIHHDKSFKPRDFTYNLVEFYRALQRRNVEVLKHTRLKQEENLDINEIFRYKVDLDNYISLSALDNDKMGLLAEVFRNFLITCISEKVTPHEFANSVYSASKTNSFHKNNVDFYDMIEKCERAEWSTAVIKEAAAKVKKAFLNTMLNEQHAGEKGGGYWGLTVNIPGCAPAIYAVMDSYKHCVKDFMEKTGWDVFLARALEGIPIENLEAQKKLYEAND